MRLSDINHSVNSCANQSQGARTHCNNVRDRNRKTSIRRWIHRLEIDFCWQILLFLNKKVLHENKRHTARRVASTRYVVPFRGGVGRGLAILPWLGFPPLPSGGWGTLCGQIHTCKNSTFPIPKEWGGGFGMGGGAAVEIAVQLHNKVEEHIQFGYFQQAVASAYFKGKESI